MLTSGQWQVHTDAGPCHRCLGDLCLQLRAPRDDGAVWLYSLCQRCDAHVPAAQGLLAYFAVFGGVTVDTAEVFADLLELWAWQLPAPPTLDPAAFQADVDAYRRGDFDDSADG